MNLQKIWQETIDDIYYIAFTKGLDEWYYDMKLVNESTTHIHTFLRFDVRLKDERDVAMSMLWQWQRTLNIKTIIWGNCGCQHYDIDTYIKKHAASYIRRFVEPFRKAYLNYESK